MTGRASLLNLAVDGLRRKLGRNLLTVSGVFIGVLALTLIIALGEGMGSVVEATISGGDNLRQIGLSPGFGGRISDESEVEIEGAMSDARRERLRRAARLRRRPGSRSGRRAQTLDGDVLRDIEAMPHVVSVAPVVLERYQVRYGDRETTATATIGIDVERRRMEERLVAGRYLAGPGADEVLIHEYLAYRWGFVTEERVRDLLGETIRLRQIRSGSGPFGASPDMIARLVERLDLSSLTEEEQEALPRIVEKLGNSMAVPADDEVATERTLTIVGVVRDREAGEPFRVIEDGNAWQVDLFLPRGTAIEMFLTSPVNREIGFTRAIVTVDDPRNAKAVETELRDLGYTAYSVATVLERIERSLGVLTLVVSFLTGIALIVAALGIVNTMVTSVLERTAEIGLWKAVGATDGQVRRVFVLEAAILGLAGGLLGLGVAALLTVPGEALAARILAQRSAVPVEAGLFRIPTWLALGGPLLATAVAVLASLYPAARAARVDPVRALRHD